MHEFCVIQIVVRVASVLSLEIVSVGSEPAEVYCSNASI